MRLASILLLCSFTLACGDKSEESTSDGSDGSDGADGSDGGSGECDPTVDADCDGSPDESDCLPNDPHAYPGAADIPYDGIDNDCAGDGDLVDVDGDGYIGESADGDDCNDANPTIYPGAAEVCYDGIDQNCDGTPAEVGTDSNDCDGDGFDGRGEGYTDCDDEDAAVNPDATEVWYDGVDQDCTGPGASDYDADLDGEDALAYGGTDCDDAEPTVNAAAKETLNGRDDDCDADDDDLTVFDATRAWYANSTSGNGWFGAVILSLPDYDGDGTRDLGVGGPYSDDDPDCDPTGDTTLCGGWFTVLNPGDPDGTPTDVEIARFSGQAAGLDHSTGDWLGYDAANLGDLDGDGWEELALGAPLRKAGAATGHVLLFSGADPLGGGERLPVDAMGDVSYDDYLGLDLAAVGDLDGDGKAELAASGSDGYLGAINNLPLRGAIWSGAALASGGNLDDTDALATFGAVTPGGQLIGGADYDGDGLAEVIVASDTATGGALTLLSGADARGGASLSLLDYPTLIGAGTDGLGFRSATLRDLDGDGLPELASAAPLAGADTGGLVYLFLGARLNAGGDAADVATTTITGDLAFGQLIVASEQGGDIDRDGKDDLVVSAAGGNISAVVRSVAWFVPGDLLAAGGTLGTDDLSTSFPSRADGDLYGWGGLVSDYDGDGDADVALGGPNNNAVGMVTLFAAAFPE